MYCKYLMISIRIDVLQVPDDLAVVVKLDFFLFERKHRMNLFRLLEEPRLWLL